MSENVLYLKLDFWINQNWKQSCFLKHVLQFFYCWIHVGIEAILLIAYVLSDYQIGFGNLNAQQATYK